MLKWLARIIASVAGLVSPARAAAPRVRRLRRTTRQSDRDRRDACELVADGRRWRVWAFEGPSEADQDAQREPRSEQRAAGLYFESGAELRFLPMAAATLPNEKRLRAMRGSDLRELLAASRVVTRRLPDEP